MNHQEYESTVKHCFHLGVARSYPQLSCKSSAFLQFVLKIVCFSVMVDMSGLFIDSTGRIKSVNMLGFFFAAFCFNTLHLVILSFCDVVMLAY